MTRIVACLFVLGLVVAGTSGANAQTAGDLVGTWAHVENNNVRADGTRNDTFGPNPKGSAIFTSNGPFSFYFHRADLPKLASNNRAQGTAEENKATVAGSIAVYGTYAVIDKFWFSRSRAHRSPKWINTDQKRPIIAYTDDAFTILNTGGSAGGQNTVRFVRLK
jgi:hypothetical protein